jgi:hypothetical protein
MGRKFVGRKEIAFSNRITRELVSNVIGQEVTYYQVLAEKTKANDLYGEAINKVFAPPVSVSALVFYENTQEKVGSLPPDSTFKLDVFFPTVELQEKNLAPKMGDFVQFDSILFEIYSSSQPQMAFGLIEQKVMTKCNCGPARKGQALVIKQPMPVTRHDLLAPKYPEQPRPHALKRPAAGPGVFKNDVFDYDLDFNVE